MFARAGILGFLSPYAPDSDSQVLFQLTHEPFGLALFHAAGGRDFSAVMQMNAKVVPDVVAALHARIEIKFLNLRCVEVARSGEAQTTGPDPQRAVYGVDRPDLTTETTAAMLAAARLVGDLDLLERLFPNGFGSLLRDLQRWEQN